MGVDRMIKHITTLGNSLCKNQRAIFLVCFIYDNQLFDIPEKDRDQSYYKVRKSAYESMNKGAEVWQINFEINPKDVILKKALDQYLF